MADGHPEEVCSFCKKGEEAGDLRNTTDDTILAHYRCLLFSPLVVSRPKTDSQDTATEFDIDSVKKEIKRGRKLRCPYCRKRGATIGCNVTSCRKTYHYLCGKKDGGVYIIDQDQELYIFHCKNHANEDNPEKDSLVDNITPESNQSKYLPKSHGSTSKKRKHRQLSASRKRRKQQERNDNGVLQNTKKKKTSSAYQLSDEDEEVAGPSRSFNHWQRCFKRDSESDVESSTSSSKKMMQNQKNGESENDTSSGEMKKTTNVPTRESENFVFTRDSESDAEPLDCSPAKKQTVNSVSGESENNLFGEEKEASHVLSCESASDSSAESCSLLETKITRVFSLSGYPKRNRKQANQRHNPELDDALLTMTTDEKQACSFLYDAVGGSLNISQELLSEHGDPNDNQMDLEDTDTDADTIIMTPETQSVNSPFEISTSKTGRPSLESKSTLFGQNTHQETSTNNCVNVTKNGKETCVILHLKDHSYCTNGEITTPEQPVDSTEDIDSSSSPMSQPVDKSISKNLTQPIDSINSKSIQLNICLNSEDSLATPPVFLDEDKHRIAKELFYVFDKFIKDHKLDRKDSANTSTALHNEPVNSYNVAKSSVKEQVSAPPGLSTNSSTSVGGHVRKRCPVARTLNFSTAMPSNMKSLNKEPTSIKKKMNNLSKNSEFINQHIVIDNKTSDEQPKLLPSTANEKAVSVEQPEKAHTSEAPVSLSTIETGSLAGVPPHSISFTENVLSSPTPKKTTIEKGKLLKPLLPTEAPQAPSSFSNITNAKTSLHDNEMAHSSYPSPQQLKEISCQLRKGEFCVTKEYIEGEHPENCGNINKPGMPKKLEIQNTLKSAKKTQPQSRDDVKSTEVTLELNLPSELTQGHSTSSNEHQKDPENPDHALSEGHSEPCLSAQQTERQFNNLDANQTNTETTTTILQSGARFSQTEISRGFPIKMEVCLNNQQKSLLLESYRRIEQQMETPVLEVGWSQGAAQAYWNLCLENGCREFLLTMLLNSTESVINKIIYNEPEDRDYEQAFAFLQASQCFEDFLKGENSLQSMNSSMVNNEPSTESESSLAKSPSIHAEAGGEGEMVPNKEHHNMMDREMPNTSSYSVNQEDNNRMGTSSLKTSAPSSGSTMTEMLSQALGTNSAVSDVIKMLLDQQDENGDAAFARSLVPFLRKIPEDKKLETRIALQNVLLSALRQNPQ